MSALRNGIDYNGGNYAIGSKAFFDGTALTSITIPNSVTSIGDMAFKGCSSLKKVCFEDGDSTLSLGANSYNENYIGGALFKDCPLETLYLGRDLSYNTDASYGYSPFYNKRELKTVTIGNSVTSIGSNAFYGCSNLEAVINFSNLTFSKGSEDYGYVACYADKVYNAPNGFIDGYFIWYENEDGMTLAGYLGNATELALPADYNGKSVTSIGNYAFSGCKVLTSIEIPNSVTSIGDGLFSGCNKSIQIINFSSVELTGNHNVINAPNGYIEGEFVYADINEVKTLCGCTVDKFSFDGLEYTINKGNFGTVTIAGASNEISGDLIIPDSVIYSGVSFKVSSINNHAFYNRTALTSIEIPNSVTSIGEGAFYICSGLTSIEIPNSVTSIGERAFYKCSGLTSIEIPNSVTSIGESAFSDCSGLTSVVIGNSVTNIGDYAFRYCAGLTSVVIGNSVTSIGNGVFTYCRRLTSVTIPNSVTSIGKSAFYGCNGLESIEISNSVTSIGDEAFYGCAGLTSIEIPNSVTSLGFGAFKNCSRLTSVKIANSVTSIGSYAFSGCSGLTKVTLGSGVREIGCDAFEKCNAIANVYIRNLATWCNIEFFSSDSNPLHSGARLLVNNAPLTSFVTPKGVTEIKKYAFFGCKGLTSVNISGSVNNVGYSAFNSCADLKTITLSNKIEELCEYAFANCEKIGSVTIKRIIKDGFIKCDHNTFDKVTYTKATLYAHPSDWRTYYNAYGWGWYRFIKVVKRQ